MKNCFKEQLELVIYFLYHIYIVVYISILNNYFPQKIRTIFIAHFQLLIALIKKIHQICYHIKGLVQKQLQVCPHKSFRKHSKYALVIVMVASYLIRIPFSTLHYVTSFI